MADCCGTGNSRQAIKISPQNNLRALRLGGTKYEKS